MTGLCFFWCSWKSLNSLVSSSTSSSGIAGVLDMHALATQAGEKLSMKAMILCAHHRKAQNNCSHTFFYTSVFLAGSQSSHSEVLGASKHKLTDMMTAVCELVPENKSSTPSKLNCLNAPIVAFHAFRSSDLARPQSHAQTGKHVCWAV